MLVIPCCMQRNERPKQLDRNGLRVYAYGDETLKLDPVSSRDRHAGDARNGHESIGRSHGSPECAVECIGLLLRESRRSPEADMAPRNRICLRSHHAHGRRPPRCRDILIGAARPGERVTQVYRSRRYDTRVHVPHGGADRAGLSATKCGYIVHIEHILCMI